MLARIPLTYAAMVKLSDWLDEYRDFQPDRVVRRVAEPEDDWREPELLAPPDRLKDTEPRWLRRAARVGYARLTEV